MNDRMMDEHGEPSRLGEPSRIDCRPFRVSTIPKLSFNFSEAALLLGVDRRTVADLAKRHGLVQPKGKALNVKGFNAIAGFLGVPSLPELVAAAS